MKTLFSFLLGLSVLQAQVKEVKIGTQVWMAKNLDVATFRNGEPIPQAKTDKEWENAGINKQPAWCYYDNNPENGTKYGKLYNWYAVNDKRGLAPAGYHIPTEAEWITLRTYLGGEEVAGTKMKSTSGWNENGNMYESTHYNGTNSSGFNGLPGGSLYNVRYKTGRCFGIGKDGYWWSSTGVNDGAWSLYLINSLDSFGMGFHDKVNGLYVRCLRD